MTDDLDRELERLLRTRRPSRRRRLWILGALLVVLVGAFLALARLSHPPRHAKQGACAAVLRFRGRVYDGVRVPPTAFVQSQAIGVATAPPCGSTGTASYDVRSLVGVSPALAVAIPGPAGVVYVARGRCVREQGAALVRCLRRGG